MFLIGSTGRLVRKLTHPTSSQFNAAEWKVIIEEDMEPSDRHFSLISAGLITGANQRRLRTSYLPHLFTGLSKLQIATFAIAAANRAWSIAKGA